MARCLGVWPSTTMDFYLYMGLEVILKVGLLIVPRTPRRGDCGTRLARRLSAIQLASCTRHIFASQLTCLRLPNRGRVDERGGLTAPSTWTCLALFYATRALWMPFSVAWLCEWKWIVIFWVRDEQLQLPPVWMDVWRRGCWYVCDVPRVSCRLSDECTRC